MTDGNEWRRGEPAQPEVYVRVWFGPTAVAHYRAERELAEQYVTAVRDHFRGLRFTVDPMPDHAPPTRPLPSWQLWTLPCGVAP